MLNLIIPLISGILLGYLLRNKKRANLSKVIFGTILTLIFSLGFSIGSNNELLNSLPKVGVNAIIICLLAVLLSMVFVKIAKTMVRI